MNVTRNILHKHFTEMNELEEFAVVMRILTQLRARRREEPWASIRMNLGRASRSYGLGYYMLGCTLAQYAVHGEQNVRMVFEHMPYNWLLYFSNDVHSWHGWIAHVNRAYLYDALGDEIRARRHIAIGRMKGARDER